MKKEVDTRLVGILMDALEEDPEAPEPDMRWLQWPTLAQYEAHAKGERRFSAAELHLIENDPHRLWMLAQAQTACRPSLGERVIAAIRNLIGQAESPSIPQLNYGYGASAGTPAAYPVLIERPDGSVIVDSEHGVTATMAPAFTPDGHLVGQVVLPFKILEESFDRGYKTELRIVAVSPRIEELANLAALPKVYFKIAVPSPFRDDKQWRTIPQGRLPFIFSIRLSPREL